MIRFALILLMSLAVNSKVVAAVNFNSGNENRYKIVSPEAKLIAENFEFVSVGLVAIDLSRRMSSIAQGILQQRCIYTTCLLYTSPSPRDAHESRMPSSA